MTDLPPPYEDTLQGACYRIGKSVVLVTGAEWVAASDVADTQVETLIEGDLHIRYAVHYEEQADALIPQLLIDDHQEQHQGLQLLKFMLARGLAYPRADVIGMRVSGGEDHVFLRELDLARPLMPLVHTQAHQSALQIDFVVEVNPDSNADGWEPITPGTHTLPEMLVSNTPCFKLASVEADDLPELVAQWIADTHTAS